MVSVQTETFLSFSASERTEIISQGELDNLRWTIGFREKIIGALNDNNNRLMQEEERLTRELEELRKEFRALEMRFLELKRLDVVDNVPVIGNVSVGVCSGLVASDVESGRVTIVGDSHARELGQILKLSLPPRCSVINHVYPGAPMNHVIGCMVQNVKEMTKGDVVFLVGGTNSFVGDCGWSEVSRYMADLRRLISLNKEVDIVLTTIPFRYDLSESSRENLAIKTVNEEIRGFASRNGVRLVELWDLPRGLHTAHGLHFNKRGKIAIAEQFAELAVKMGRHFRTSDICWDHLPFRDGISSPTSLGDTNNGYMTMDIDGIGSYEGDDFGVSIFREDVGYLTLDETLGESTTRYSTSANPASKNQGNV